MKNAFYLNLSIKNENLVTKVIDQYSDIKIHKLEKLTDILHFANRSEADFLFLDINSGNNIFKENINLLQGKLLNTKIIFILNESDTNATLDQQLLSSIVKKVDSIILKNSLLQNISKIHDSLFENGNSISKKEDSYIPLDLIYLSSIKKSPCDIFVKISEKKYIKIINKDDDFKIDEIFKNYQNKKINDFYIQFNGLNKFRDSILGSIFKFDSKKDVATTHQLKVADTVLSIAKDFGVSEFVVDGINDTFSEIGKEFITNAKLKNFMEDLSKLEGTIIGNHSYLTSVFITMIGVKVPWFTKEVKKNLYTAAILHDLELVGTGLEEYEFKELEEINLLKASDKDIVKNHSTNLAKKLSKLDVIPSDVINIISKHHEGAGSKSYPQGLNGPQLSPPICVFNVAHRFSIELTKIAFNQSKYSEAIKNTREYLSSNSFKPFIDILENSIL